MEKEKENKSKKKKAPTTKSKAPTKRSTPVAPDAVPARKSALYTAPIEKVRLPATSTVVRRIGLSRAAPTRPLSPVKILKFD